jgi:serine/threonine-protein kinase
VSNETVKSIWSALGGRIEKEERLLTTVGFAVSLTGLLFFVPLGLAVCGWDEMRISTSVAVLAVVWFGVAIVTPPGGGLWRAQQPIGIAFVGSIPAVLIYGMFIGHGALHAFGSWTAAQLAVVIVAGSGLSLRVWYPLATSVVSAGTYLGLYVAIRADLPPVPSPDTLWSVESTAYRVGTLLAWGALWTTMIWGLRRSLARAFSDLRALDLFGKYRLGKKIASGGMGTVCRATYCPEGGFERDVAIKRIHPHLADRPSVVERFRREAQIGARLHHPNIVATLDFGRVDDTYFVAMEYVDGASLRTLVRRCIERGQPVPPRIVAWLGREVCRGLDFAHQRATDGNGDRLRIVHDDICPDNILLTRAGVPKIADFGVSRALREEQKHVTKHVVGKVGYLAPEQVEGKPFDARADLFSLGCVLWEALAGRRLFGRHDVAQALKAIITGEVPELRAIRGELDARWAAFFQHALATDPARRFPDAGTMGAALDNLCGAAVEESELLAWLHPLLDDTDLTRPNPPASGREEPTLTTPLDASAHTPVTVEATFVDEREPARTLVDPPRAAA